MPKSPAKMKAVKDRIFHAAMELFEQQGYENTSVEQITKRAGVSKGTFFTHFPSKDAVFSAIGRIFTEYFQEIVENGLRENHSMQRILRDSIHMAAVWCEENKPMIGQVIASGMHPPSAGSHSTGNRVAMLELLGRVLRAGQAQGEIRGDISADDVSAMITGLYFTVMFDWINDGGVWSMEDKLRNYLELLFRGIRP